MTTSHMNDTRKTPLEQAELSAFARRLEQLMEKQGMSQSDLARAIWGSTVDSRGRDVARNRDRISNYVRGNQMPEAKTVGALATALGVTVNDLHQPAAGSRTAAQPVDVSMSLIAGRPDLALLVVNGVMPTSVAVAILSLIQKAVAAESERTAP